MPPGLFGKILFEKEHRFKSYNKQDRLLYSSCNLFLSLAISLTSDLNVYASPYLMSPKISEWALVGAFLCPMCKCEQLE